MEHHSSSWVMKHLRGRFVAGLLLLVPLMLTYLVLRLLFNTVDGLLQPAVAAVAGRTIPGAGAIMLIVLVYLAGVLATNMIGQGLIRLGQFLLLRVPIVNTVYSASRQLIESFSSTSATGFKRVVTIEYPRRGIWTIGFLTGMTEDENGEAMAIVYIPTAPAPTSGWVAVVPVRDVYDTDLPVPVAMRMVLSGGILTPPQIIKRQQVLGPEKAG